MLISGRYKDTAGGVLGFGASVEADACSPRNLLEDGQGSLELGALGDGDAIDECGDEAVSVFEGVADVVQTLHEEAGTLVDVMRGAVEFAGDCRTRIRFGANRRRVISDKFIIHRSKKTHAKIKYKQKRHKPE